MADHLGAEVYRKYGITRPIFAKFADQPHGIGWLARCLDALPMDPGFVYMGIGNEVKFIKLAETPIREFVRRLYEEPGFALLLENVNPTIGELIRRDFDQLWIAWVRIRFTDDPG